MSNRDFEEWFMKEIADDDGDYNKPVYEAAKWAWQARVPEGYVVVPKEPTDEMLKVANKILIAAYELRISNNQCLKRIYQAMIEAQEPAND